MQLKTLSLLESRELKLYIKKQLKKIKTEGSASDSAGAYATPAAFTGDEKGDGTDKLDLEDDQYAFSIVAPKTNKTFVKIHEISYKTFKEDVNTTEVQKINHKILEVNRSLREISRALDHSLKLKQESKLDNSRYWKRTNEAILKISKRLLEVNKKARKLANINELAAASAKDKIIQLFTKANIELKADDVTYNKVGADHYEFDIYISGEPYAIDFEKGELTYQGFDKEVRLGNIKQENEVIKQIAQTFKQ